MTPCGHGTKSKGPPWPGICQDGKQASMVRSNKPATPRLRKGMNTCQLLDLASGSYRRSDQSRIMVLHLVALQPVAVAPVQPPPQRPHPRGPPVRQQTHRPLRRLQALPELAQESRRDVRGVHCARKLGPGGGRHHPAPCKAHRTRSCRAARVRGATSSIEEARSSGRPADGRQQRAQHASAAGCDAAPTGASRRQCSRGAASRRQCSAVPGRSADGAQPVPRADRLLAAGAALHAERLHAHRQRNRHRLDEELFKPIPCTAGQLPSAPEL